MKSFSVVVVSVIALACFAANASALLKGLSDSSQDVCDIKSNMQQNLASVLTDPVGVQTLNDAREIAKDMCKDPRAHNAIVDLLNVITDVATDPNVSQTLGNALYWARQVLKEKNFRVIWLEMMRGLNMTFDNVEVASQQADATYDFLEELLRSPHFETSFDRTMSSVGKVLKARNDNPVMSLAYTLASKAKYSQFVGGGGGGKGRTVRPAAGQQRPSGAAVKSATAGRRPGAVAVKSAAAGQRPGAAKSAGVRRQPTVNVGLTF